MTLPFPPLPFLTEQNTRNDSHRCPPWFRISLVVTMQDTEKEIPDAFGISVHVFFTSVAQGIELT